MAPGLVKDEKLMLKVFQFSRDQVPPPWNPSERRLQQHQMDSVSIVRQAGSTRLQRHPLLARVLGQGAVRTEPPLQRKCQRSRREGSFQEEVSSAEVLTRLRFTPPNLRREFLAIAAPSVELARFKLCRKQSNTAGSLRSQPR